MNQTPLKRLMLLLAAVAAAGCLHTRQVDTGQPVEGEQEGAAAENPEAEKGAKKPAAASGPSKATAASPKKSSAEARAPVEEGRPELSVSPEGLMRPEGPRLIQDALAKRGYLPNDHQTGKLDEKTSAAVRKFQGDEELAKTGAPDRETIRRLGLSLGKVFRNSSDREPSATTDDKAAKTATGGAR